MILDFHEMIGPGQQLEQEFGVLQEIMESSRSLASQGQSRTVSNLTDDLTRRLPQTFSSSDRHLLRQARLALQSCTSTARFELVVAGLGRAVIRPVSLGNNEYDIDFLYHSLCTYGPLYCSSYSFDRFLSGSLVPDPLNSGSSVWSFGANDQHGGRHAIVIAGADTSSGNVFIKDPQCAQRFTVTTWDALMGNLNSPGGSIGDSLFGYVDCPSCPHLNKTV
jgi:hypothetical protein